MGKILFNSSPRSPTTNYSRNIAFWQEGYGAQYNPDRNSLEKVSIKRI